MTLDLQEAARRRMRRALVVLIAIVLVLVALVVVMALTGGSDGQSKGAPAPQASAPQPSASPVVDDPGGYVAPAKTVALPAGTAKSGNLPTGFARTPEGAAAMAVASARNAWSFDPAQIKAGILTYAAAAVRDSMAQDAESGAQGNRKYAGIPTSGPVPAGATLNAWPIGVQWNIKNTSTVDILVLLRVTHAAGTGEKQATNLVVSPTEAVWEGSDWKISPAAEPDTLPDPVDIGSAKFNSDGWTAIQEGDRR
ncbi:hypothetical protein [Streptomyces sp. HUAS TT7]|uniref:hypothetical protein n=1 Tax=Streptomyces sp. HUAS TT7 TaxID=3447507 RepID=UPI003F6588A2